MSDVLVQSAPRTVIRELPKILFYSDGGIYLKDVRLSYPHLDKPWAMTDRGEKKYQLMGLVPKLPEYRESIDALNRYLDEFLAERKLQPLPQARKFLRNGDDTGKPEMMNHWTVSASEKQEPRLRGRHIDQRTGTLEIIPPEEAAKVFYGGCWANVLIKAWYQDHPEGGRRLNANLHAVQFVRHDKPFGRGRISDAVIDETFGEIPDEEGGYEGASYDL
jgi:hypothetical protein